MFQIRITPNIRTSPYFDATVADGVKGFSVYNNMFIPAQFGDPEAEYDRLLNGVAMWDVAAQRQVALEGPDAGRLAQILTPRNLEGLEAGQARYVPICDHEGLLLNDPVLLKLAGDRYWLSIADSDLRLWVEAVARERGLDVAVTEPDVAPLAIQGPKAMDVAEALFGGWVRDLKRFTFRETALDGIPLLVSRSGWSRQGGVELYLRDGSFGTDLWNRVKEAGRPFGIGPGAPNDTERLESGLISYGSDARRETCPANAFEMGFGRMIDLDGPHDFIGRDALRRIAEAGVRRRRTGIVVDGPPPAPNRTVLDLLDGDRPIGVVNEIAHSKRLGKTIGVGLVPASLEDGTTGLSIHLPEGTRRVTLAGLPFA
jgi:glycine cleavage system aminomethyltransferase T